MQYFSPLLDFWNGVFIYYYLLVRLQNMGSVAVPHFMGSMLDNPGVLEKTMDNNRSQDPAH